MGDFLLLAFVFLFAGVVAVPIASRLGLGSVLGYLLAGIALSPLLAAIGVDVIAIQHFAEFGVVMMLFLVGLELEPRRLWDMRGRLLGLGGLQVVGTTLVIMAAAMALGLSWSLALATGMILALSSTAIILQTLNEKGLMQSDGGQASFSVLLFQDIAVIPMLTLLPLLALPELADLASGGEAGHGGGHAEDGAGGDRHANDEHGDDDHSLSLVSGLPGWLQGLISLGAIASVVAGGSVLTRPIFRFIDMAHLRELFTAAALMLVVGIALLMSLVGLSPALGTFVAGVVLANSEYRHELESDIEPFKGLLLGLFFITVGASINFDLLMNEAGVIIPLTLGLIGVKVGILYVLALIFKIHGPHRWLLALGLAQAGEFGFVLVSFSVGSAVIPQALADQLLLIVALSMLLTPLLFIIYDRVIAPRYNREQERDADRIDATHRVIIAGHGRFGGIVNRMLRLAGYDTTVLDYSSRQLDILRTFGFEVYFGDATRPDLLHAAGIETAKVLVVAIDEREQITNLTRHVVQKYPHVHVIARAVNRDHVYELYSAGCRDIIRETFDGGVRTGRSALEALGIHPFAAQRMAQQFEREDRAALAELASLHDPDTPAHLNGPYVAKAREIRERREAELSGGGGGAFAQRKDRGWSPPSQSDVEAEKKRSKS